jgi:predicted ATPase
VSYRPEWRHGWASKTYYNQVRVNPLPAAGAGALLDALLGRAPELAAIRQLLIERTEGNPFFLEESVRALVETGALAGERGAYRLTTALTRIEVPATVQAVLAARIDRLPSQDKRLLQVASVVGKDVPGGLLQAIADLADEALQSGLGHLQAAEFLYETSLYPEPEYTFKHALTHEVAYGGLLHDRHRDLHARIVDAIEARHANRLAEHIDRLAYHASRAERWDKATEYLHQAGIRAADRSAHRSAIDWLEQALAALEHVPTTRESVRRGLDIILETLRQSFARCWMSLSPTSATATGPLTCGPPSRS